MAAGILSFTGLLAVKTNADFNFTLTCVDSSTGSAIDFTGYSAKMSIGTYTCTNSCPGTCGCSPELTIIYTLTSTGSTPAITFPNPTTGVIQLNIPESVTNTLPITTDGLYDLLLFPPGSAVQEFLQGPIQILSGVTSVS